MKFSLFILMLSICIYAQTQSEMNVSAYRDYKKADSILNVSYQRILKKNSYNELFVKKFVNSQKVWLKYRDSYMESVFPDTTYLAYGSIYPMCFNLILLRLTKNRNEELQEWIDGLPEGEACSGSRGIK